VTILAAPPHSAGHQFPLRSADSQLGTVLHRRPAEIPSKNDMAGLATCVALENRAQGHRVLGWQTTSASYGSPQVGTASSGAVCICSAEHPDDGDQTSRLIDSVEHAVGSAAGTVLVA
jgi:hypothetical protein